MFDLRRFSIVLATSLLAITASSQEFSFNMYFEDNLGNRDTLTLGYDSTATDGLDTVWGEQNIKNQPFDSVFEVRSFPCAVPCDEEEDISFMFKKQFKHSTCKSEVASLMGIAIKCDKCWPITLTWNSSFFQDQCKNNSFITDWPTKHWPDAYHDERNQGPFLLNKHDSLSFDYTSGHFRQNADSIHLLYFAFADHNGFVASFTTGAEFGKNDDTGFTIYPNPATKILNLEFPNRFQKTGQIRLFNATGQLVLQEKAQKQIDVSGLNKGLHVIQLVVEGKALSRKTLIVK